MRRRTRTWSAAGMPTMRDLLAESLLAHAAFGDEQAAHARADDCPEEADERATEAAGDRVLADRLGAATMWWVTRDMSMAALDASRDIPMLSVDDCPADSGLIAFAQPLPLLDTSRLGGFEVQLRDGSTTVLTHTHVDAMIWTRHGTDIRLYPCVLVHRLPGVIPGHTAPLQPFMVVGGTMPLDFTVLDDGQGTISGRTLPGAVPIGTEDPIAALVAMLAATWILGQTPTVASTRRLERPRHTSSQPIDTGPPYGDQVTLLDLRAPRHIRTPDDEQRSGRRQYRQRWIVRGHWRQQAVGPKRGQRRATWIPSHIKGPEGAPLKTSEHVYVWRR